MPLQLLAPVLRWLANLLVLRPVLLLARWRAVVVALASGHTHRHNTTKHTHIKIITSDQIGISKENGYVAICCTRVR